MKDSVKLSFLKSTSIKLYQGSSRAVPCIKEGLATCCSQIVSDAL